jgi:hypothetical protein
VLFTEEGAEFTLDLKSMHAAKSQLVAAVAAAGEPRVLQCPFSAPDFDFWHACAADASAVRTLNANELCRACQVHPLPQCTHLLR